MLDSRTIFFYLGTSLVMIALVYIAFYLITTHRRFTLMTFAVSKALEAFGLMGIAMRGEIPDLYSIQLANTLLILGIGTEVASVMHYRGQLRRIPLWGIGTFTLVAIAAFWATSSVFVVRSIVGAIFGSVATSVVSIDLLIGRRGLKFPLVLSFSFALYAATRYIDLVHLLGLPLQYQPQGTQVVSILTLVIATTSIVHSVAYMLLMGELDNRLIHQKNRLLAVAFEQSPVGVMITQPNGTIEYANEQTSRITGFAPDELLGRNPRIQKSDRNPPELFAQLWQSIIEKRNWRGEIVNRRKDGSLYTEELSIAPIKNEQDEIEKFVAIKSDISQRKEQEQIIRQNAAELAHLNEQLQKANELKTQLFSIIAHDLRGPIGALSAVLDLMQNEAEMDPRTSREFLQTAANTARSSFDLLENLLLWTRSQQNTLQPKPESIELASALNRLHDLHAVALRNKRIDLQSHIAPQLRVWMDPDLLLLVLRNLLSNAIKFTPDSGRIQLHAHVASEQVVLRIKDSGLGIAPEQLATVFDPERNRSTPGTHGERGTGLGLPLVKEFVEKSGGHIRVESHLGAGTCFELHLPLA